MSATPMTDLSRCGHSALFTDVNGCWCLDLVAHEAALAANTFAVKHQIVCFCRDEETVMSVSCHFSKRKC
jgi:hypothetical protein